MPVAQGAQEAGFCTILGNVRFQSRGGAGATVQFLVGRFPQEFVAKRDLVKDTVVHRRNELVVRVPILLVEILDRTVVPGDHRFIRRQLLGFPVLTNVGRKAFVNARNIGLTSRTFLATECQAGI